MIVTMTMTLFWMLWHPVFCISFGYVWQFPVDTVQAWENLPAWMWGADMYSDEILFDTHPYTETIILIIITDID